MQEEIIQFKQNQRFLNDQSKDNKKIKLKDKSSIYSKVKIPLSQLKEEKKFFTSLSNLSKEKNNIKYNKCMSPSKSVSERKMIINQQWNCPYKLSSLYTILAMKKGQLMNEYINNSPIRDFSQRKSKKFSKELNYFNNNNNSFLCEYGVINKNEKEFNNYVNRPQIYISNFYGDLINSEKLRYKSMMEKLVFLKNFIRENPKKSKDIIKKFLINNGIFNPNFISESKIKNFIYFIKRNFDIDPSKSFHENLINILNGNYYNISKKKLNIKKIEFSTIEKRDIFKNNKKSQSITKFKKYLDHINKDFKFKTEGIKWELDLRQNLNRQKEVCRNYKVFDIVNQPEKIIDTLEDEIKKQKHFDDEAFAKTFCGWNKKDKNFELKLGNLDVIDRNCNVDIEQLKKNNLLTEYVCLVTAKKNCINKEITKQYNLI